MINKKTLINILGTVSITSFLYCVFAYIFIQTTLTTEIQVIPKSVDIIGDITVVSILIMFVFHVCLLFNALKMMKGTAVHSIYMILIVLSGITLLSDITILHDIGMEYRDFDISRLWSLLYGFTFVHGIILFYGTFYINKNWIEAKEQKRILNHENEKTYYSISYIGIVTSILGILGIAFANLAIFTPDEYALAYTIILAVLVLFPLTTVIVYWITKLKDKSLRELFDEKQTQDMAIGCIVSLLISLPVYLLIIILELTKIVVLDTVSWILIVFFIQLLIVSSTVKIKNYFTP